MFTRKLRNVRAIARQVWRRMICKNVEQDGSEYEGLSLSKTPQLSSESSFPSLYFRVSYIAKLQPKKSNDERLNILTDITWSHQLLFDHFLVPSPLFWRHILKTLLPISHNAPYFPQPPIKKLNKHCFQFLLTAVIPRRNEKQGYANLWKCGSGELLIRLNI